MTKIKTMKDWNEEHTQRVPFVPRGHVKAIFDDNGNTLDSLMAVQDEKLSELGSEVNFLESRNNVEITSFSNSSAESGITEVGQYYINTSYSPWKLLRCKYVSSPLSAQNFEEVTFKDGAYYIYGGKKYIWVDENIIPYLENSQNEMKETESLRIDKLVFALVSGREVSRFNSTASDVLKMELGALNITSGELGTNIEQPNRARSYNYINAPFKVTLNNGYQFASMLIYNVTQSGDITYERAENIESVVELSVSDKSKLYKFTVKKTDNSDIVSVDSIIKTFKGKFTVTEELIKNEIILSNEETLSKIKPILFDKLNVESGTLSISGNLGMPIVQSNRVRSCNYLTAPFKVTLKDGYTFRSLFSYKEDENGVFSFENVENIEALSELYVKDSSKVYKFTLGKNDNSDIASFDSIVKSFKGRITIEDDLLKGDIVSAAWTNEMVTANTLTISANVSYKLSSVLFFKAGSRVWINTAGSGIGIISECTPDGSLTKLLLETPKDGYTYENVFYQYTFIKDAYVRICYKSAIEGAFVKAYDHKNIMLRSLLKAEERIKVLENFDKEDKHLRILVLGNSYAADSWAYVPFILKQYGITVDITLYYRGALSLKNLYERWDSEAATDTEEGLNAGTYERAIFHIDSRTESRWTTIDRVSAKTCVEMGGWDIISLQQWSGYSIDINSYEPYTTEIIKLINNSLKTPYTLAWSMAFTRPAYDQISESLSTHKQHIHNTPTSLILPYGTAIFMARQDDVLKQVGDYQGDSTLGYPAHNFWCEDGVHIQEGLPKYAAALAIVQALFNRFYPENSVLGNQLRPTQEIIDTFGGMEIRGKAAGVTEDNCLKVQKNAIKANNHPFEL